MKMSVRESIKYIVKANGMPYSTELYLKVMQFIKKLPRNPSDDKGNTYTVKDYSEGWFAVIYVGVSDNGNIVVELIDGDNLDPSATRVKSNAEALEILKQIQTLTYPSEYDPTWEMSDNYKYWSKMNQEFQRVLVQERVLLSKL